MPLTVACMIPPRNRGRDVARAMAEGIRKCGDVAKLSPCSLRKPDADVALMYGWKWRRMLQTYPQYLYADLGYWVRETHYRICVGGWSPQGYVKAGLPADRLESFGLHPKPWNRRGDNIVIAGSSAKSAIEHGLKPMEWEEKAAALLAPLGRPIVFRPKDTDKMKRPLSGAAYDEGPLSETLANAWAVVTHHSNTALDALLAGVPAHCETGAAAAFSVPMDSIGDPPLLEGREQFLADVAWLNWTLDEMRSGACWAHMKERRIIRC